MQIRSLATRKPHPHNFQIYVMLLVPNQVYNSKSNLRSGTNSSCDDMQICAIFIFLALRLLQFLSKQAILDKVLNIKLVLSLVWLTLNLFLLLMIRNWEAAGLIGTGVKICTILSNVSLNSPQQQALALKHSSFVLPCSNFYSISL